MYKFEQRDFIKKYSEKNFRKTGSAQDYNQKIMKKVLFITYFWPPSGKASLHWPLDIIRNLPKDEIKSIILTVEEETFTQKDESLLSKVDPNWQIIKSKALEPFDLYRIFIGKKKNEKLVASDAISLENKSLTHRISIWIRMNLFVPDARVGWNFTAIPKAKNFLDKNKVDTIVSIGPPHSSHLIGLKLSKRFKIPHIPVLIDPWVDIFYYKNLKRSALTKKIDNHFEKSVLENAQQVVFVTKSTEEDYLKKYSFLRNKTNVLYWGYDEEVFESLPGYSMSKSTDFKVIPVKTGIPKTKDNMDSHLRGNDNIENDASEIHSDLKIEKILVHAGNMFAYQNPKNFWKQIKLENDKGNKISIRFIGTVDKEILEYLYSIGLKENVHLAGFLPYKEMIKEIMQADMILVCATEPRHVPGKLFEALRTGNPIIAFGDNNEEVKKIIEDANAGMMFRYDESGEEFLEGFKNFKSDIGKIRNFDRKKIAEDFRSILNRV